MRITAIMPCHNAKRWLGQALGSMVGQTRRPDEIVVVDDSSTDGSVAAIEAWARAAPVPVVLKRVEKRNAAATRNVGVDVASGDWIALLDSDDAWCPEHLERAESLLASGDDVAFMGHRVNIHAEANQPEKSLPAARDTASSLTGRDYLDLVARKGWKFTHSTVLYHRQSFLDAGAFDPEMVRRHDIDLWLRVLAKGTWTYDAQPHAKYRVDTPGSISRKVVDAEIYHLRALLRNREAYPGRPMETLVHELAFRSISKAWSDAHGQQRKDVVREAWPHLSRKTKAVLSPFRVCPSIYGMMNRLRRRLKGVQMAKE